jgi:hypothetical protein
MHKKVQSSRNRAYEKSMPIDHLYYGSIRALAIHVESRDRKGIAQNR